MSNQFGKLNHLTFLKHFIEKTCPIINFIISLII